MLAIRVREFGEPEVMRLEEVDDPVPAAGQVLVRLHAAGVNPVDTYVRAGAYSAVPQLPYTPGNDGAGIVEATGDGTAGFHKGDRVYIAGSLTGTYAQMALCEEFQVHRLPERVSCVQGSALGVPYGTAWRALFQRGNAVPAENVLIHGGTGGVGLAAIQMARAAGITVTASAGSDTGKETVMAHGAHYAVDHRLGERPEEARKLTGGKGFDLILEMLANENLGRDLGILAAGGRVVVIGSRGKVEIDPRLTMGAELSILGMTLNAATREELRSIHSALAAGLENGTLRPVVGKEMPLANAIQAHKEVMLRHPPGKIALIP
ncbi:MAG TPA: NADPH:quinone reductase [Chthonomonadales bacterium]|nr:NADPH:quinone reductase [Chthonomonadales bacterium]